MDQNFVPPRSSSRSVQESQQLHLAVNGPNSEQRLQRQPVAPTLSSLVRTNSDNITGPLARQSSSQPPRRHHSDIQSSSIGHRTSREVISTSTNVNIATNIRRSDSSDSSSTSRKRVASNAAENIYGNKRTSSNTQFNPTSMNYAQNRGSSARNPIDLTSPGTSPTPAATPPIFRFNSNSSSLSRSNVQLPPWQPDNDVSQCPVCKTSFGFLYRKHHCRKCGKVVCDNCSRHRIGLPRQYIVHPPPGASSSSSPFSSTFSALGVSASLQVRSSQPTNINSPAGFGNASRHPTSDATYQSGAEVVRVCKPCVPDPNLSPPPQTPTSGEDPPGYLDSAPFPVPIRNASTNQSPTLNPSARYATNVRRAAQMPVQIPERRGSGWQGLTAPGSTDWHPTNSNLPSNIQQTGVQRRATVTAGRLSPLISGVPAHTQRQPLPYSPSGRHAANVMNLSVPVRSGGARTVPNQPGSSVRPISNQPAARPPRPRIPEEDECPVCGNELPPKGTDGNTRQREQHVEECIQLHSFSSSIPTTAPTSTPASVPNVSTARGRSVSSLETQRQPPSLTPQSTGQTINPRSSSLSSFTAAESSSMPADTPLQRPRGNRMIVYRASEKDCLGEDGEPQECVICFEEFEPGHEMGRLECWCKFHRVCIRRWWETKGPGSCPTHQLHQ